MSAIEDAQMFNKTYRMNEKSYCDHKPEDSWWEYDERLMPITRVCESCREHKLKQYSSHAPAPGSRTTRPVYKSRHEEIRHNAELKRIGGKK